MHRTVNPWCSCDNAKGAQHVTCVMYTPECSSEECTPSQGQPYITKPSAIRANRGHRSWMTHLPLSRPAWESFTAI